ncbi:hypothetical protein EIN_337630 [Entamoeba invadens IP1]|uniref:EGF-like domain-containing protein n=1 Tax=Entamoeba invadens IP1 TaxID=370355 RepID=A0A0A1TV23_ENTIV|nr:hypothetical protein EIN_337630 [Entamoeba invadens IP1]ELP84164.1 hypothetical protein EIN_337630 [Entamoeba invadens IP1]|eukprot:XP_004183510.1 hypothetical protein EIN_337630 [Entamoeba invadens IP1]
MLLTIEELFIENLYNSNLTKTMLFTLLLSVVFSFEIKMCKLQNKVICVLPTVECPFGYQWSVVDEILKLHQLIQNENTTIGCNVLKRFDVIYFANKQLTQNTTTTTKTLEKYKKHDLFIKNQTKIILNGNYCGNYPNCASCTSVNGIYHCNQCIDGFYKSDEYSCSQCYSGCANCTGSGYTECTSCVTPGYYRDNITCVACVVGCAGYTCYKCYTGCRNCTSSKKRDCTSCVEGYYKSGGYCYECYTGCLTCTGPSNGLCSTCAKGYYLTYNSCLKCSVGCLDCTSSKDGYCQICESGYFWSEGKCVRCYTGCSTCNNTNNISCFSCVTGYFLNRFSCVQCSVGCATCRENGENCGTCISGYYLSGSKCIQCPTGCETCFDSGYSTPRCMSCFDGYYRSSYSCFACTEGCQTRSSNLNCYSCINGYSLYGISCHQCYDGCSTCNNSILNGYCLDCVSVGYYYDNGYCNNCSVNCRTCEGSSSNCTSCEDGTFYLKDNKCLKCNNCGDGNCHQHGCTKCTNVNYYTSGYDCMICDESCQTCDGGLNTNCLSCKIGFYLDNKQCKRCDSNCDRNKCDTVNGCTSCKENYFAFKKTCHPCSDISNCLSCSPTNKKCTTCSPHFEIRDGVCICNAGYYLSSSNTCTLCYDNTQHGNCKTCHSSDETQFEEVCDLCYPPFVLNTDASSCSKCSNGSHYNNNRCVAENQNCLARVNMTTCVKCDENYYLKDFLCVLTLFDSECISKGKITCEDCESGISVQLNCNNEINNCKYYYINKLKGVTKCLNCVDNYLYTSNEIMCIIVAKQINFLIRI